jgi:hypothetical protein
MTVTFGGKIMNEYDDYLFDETGESLIDHAKGMNGKIQRIPLYRDDQGDEIMPDFEIGQGMEVTDEEWKKMPHMLAIRDYAYRRPGWFHYYWTRSLALLNKSYMDWFRTIPAESPLHIHRNYEEIFVEMHIYYFESGLTGYIGNKF